MLSVDTAGRAEDLPGRFYATPPRAAEAPVARPAAATPGGARTDQTHCFGFHVRINPRMDRTGTSAAGIGRRDGRSSRAHPGDGAHAGRRDAAEGRGDRLPTKEEVAGAGGGGDFTARASGPGSLARETGAARLCLGDLAEAADGRAHGGGRRRVHRVRAARNLRRRHGSALIEIELG